MAETKTYRGNCHCGTFVFELTGPEITAAHECTCSICYKKGATWTFPGESSSFKIVKGDENDLKEYLFGSKKTHYKFCPTCGTSLYGTAPTMPPGMNMAVNTRAIQDLKIWDLSVNTFDGANTGAPYEAPEFKGEEPPAEIDGGKTYHGSCHCGAVTVAIKTKPLDETYDAMIAECNCSIDQRAGAVWIYASESQVSISGAENLRRYDFGRFDWSFAFCQACGIPVVRRQLPKTEEDLAAMDERRRGFMVRMKDKTPVNLRLLNGFDVSKSGLKVSKNDGWEACNPQYVNP
ncbi:Mss4-like protein [Zalerion maritima]|uniref:Mss4-like protein n=1 Tax=Zalerion maritima TaxID=339359 RepID=A0AAD5WSA0_9PEZI|nr:Mss4-like protein [Zalerion maritima]